MLLGNDQQLHHIFFKFFVKRKMYSVKWKYENWIVRFKKFDNFNLIHLIVEKLDVFNFQPFFSLCYTREIWAGFLKNIHQK